MYDGMGRFVFSFILVAFILIGIPFAVISFESWYRAKTAPVVVEQTQEELPELGYGMKVERMNIVCMSDTDFTKNLLEPAKLKLLVVNTDAMSQFGVIKALYQSDTRNMLMLVMHYEAQKRACILETIDEPSFNTDPNNRL